MVLIPSAASGGGTPIAATSSRASPALGFSMQQPVMLRQKTAQVNSNGYHPNKPPAPLLSSMKSVPLDLNSVERRGQPSAVKEPRPKKNRPHGLEEAPTYYPTEEEFKDPFKYIQKIAPVARNYGICKIVPPESWNPDFAINTEKFHFRTRKQELNSVEGSTRANLTYLDGLAKFHKQNGNNNLTRLPYVDKKPLDLYRLKKAVETRGGFDKVCKLKKWAEIGRDLGYSGKIMSSLSTSLKNSYQKWLCPYEDYLKIARPGVYQQLELESGGPLTPSPVPSPMKRSSVNTPTRGDSPAQQASDALQASVNGQAEGDAPMPDTAGLTSSNTGGFKVIDSGFTSVKRASSLDSQAKGSSTSQHGTPVSSSANTPDFRSNLGASSTLKRQTSCESIDLMKDDSEAGSRRSKRLKKESVPTVAGSHMSLFRPSVPRIPQDESSSLMPCERCEQCGRSDEHGFLLMCESCDHSYHGACLDPQVKHRPGSEWNCPRCLVGDGQFGFEEGGLYSLKQFQEKAADFKQGYFAKKIPYDPILKCHRPVTEDDVEREFWRLVADLEETVEVEYGADIHCTTHGSGFPTIERNPDNVYSTDPWNLNILPLHPESLFRHIKTDISGMTVPWVYVGMVFSTFCWHAEDHWSYSANYQHLGATKTWYGIPGEDADKFEQAMKDAVPELFETQPDLLFQLVTLLTPEHLKKAGVRVYALDQRAGQFVITFPQAYHAGFNHGFNFNEAVNFAPRDWEPFGLSDVERRQQFRRQPCFSHDELLWTAADGITSSGLTIQTAKWLAPALDRIQGREQSQREDFIMQHLSTSNHDCTFKNGSGEACPLTFKIEDVDVSEEEYSCAYCKAYTYLSRFKCERSGKVLCLLHAGAHPCCDQSERDRFAGKGHVLYYRKSDDAIAATYKKVAEKAHVPEAWEEKYEKLLDEEATPSLKAMRTLLGEGEKIPHELPSLSNLKKFVDRCNQWIEEATVYTVRKQLNRRKNERLWQKDARRASGNASHDQKEREGRSVEDIYRLLEEAAQVGFDCPEILQLQERANAIKAFQESAAKSLADRQPKTAADVDSLIEEGQKLNVDLPEIEKLTRHAEQLRWAEHATNVKGTVLSLQEVDEMIAGGHRLGISPYQQPLLSHYAEQLASGRNWENKVREIIEADFIHYNQLQALANQAQDACLPVSPETMAKVDSILQKQREAERQIVDLNERSRHSDLRQRPHYNEVSEVMKKVEELQSKPAGTLELEKEQKRHEDWMRKGKKLFGKTNAPLHILKSHLEYVNDRNLDCFEFWRDRVRVPVEPASREPSPDVERDKRGSSNEPDPVFCICRRPEAGMMIECELCHEWYHGRCLKIARGKVKEDDKYTCPVCDWRVKIPRDATRPKLEDLVAWYEEIPSLPFQPEEEEVLKQIIGTAQEFREHIRPYTNDMTATWSESDTQRFYLRKIEGAEILLAYETNFFRQMLHKFHPVAPNPPPLLEESRSTRKPRPTKLQKLLQEYGVEDPDDLPESVRGKANSLKRKALNAELAAQAAAQANTAGPTAPSPIRFHFGQGGNHYRIPSDQPTTPGLPNGSGSHTHTPRRPDSASQCASHGGPAYPPNGLPESASVIHPEQMDIDARVHPTFFPQNDDGPQLTVSDSSKLPLDDRLLSAQSTEEMERLMDTEAGRRQALEILRRTEAGRQKAEELFGRDATVTRHAGRGTADDPIGVGAEMDGDGDVSMFTSLVNEDEGGEARRAGQFVEGGNVMDSFLDPGLQA